MFIESRKLKALEKAFSINDKERFSIMHALVIFWQNLVCEKFVVRVDHDGMMHESSG